MRKKRQNLEHQIQAAAIKWRDDCKYQLSELYTLHSIPNGGLRDKITAAILKAEGVLPGMPDLHLPCGHGGYFSLYIEVKKPGGVLSQSQKEMIPLLKAQNNKVEVCDNTQDIIDTVIEYLKMEPTLCHLNSRE